MEQQPDDNAMPPIYFVCYDRVDSGFVEKIVTKLGRRIRNRELDVWVDRRNLDPGTVITPEIEVVLSEAVGAIVLVSDEFYDSAYIQAHEWPVIESRWRHEGLKLYPLMMTTLDADDPLREVLFTNDLREPLRESPEVVARTLQRLSDDIGAHAKSWRPADTVDREGRRVDIDRSGRQPVAASAMSTGPRWSGMAEFTLRPGVYGVPPDPPGIIAPIELDRVVAAVRGSASSAITGLRGEGGTGKSVLAAAVARVVADECPGGVHWITVGEKLEMSQVAQLQHELLTSMGLVLERPLRDENQGKDVLADALARIPCLVVVDDVWEPWQMRLLAPSTPNGAGRVLVTSRFPDVLSLGTSEIEIDRLNVSESTSFLRQAAGSLPGSHDDLAAVLDVADGLRLALAVLAAAARIGSWADVTGRLPKLDELYGSGDDASAAHKSLHVGISLLDEDDRRRLWQLAALPADIALPAGVLCRLWGLDDPHAAAAIDRFVARALVKWSDSARQAVEPHDHLHDLLVIDSPLDPVSTHVRVWELAHTLGGAGYTTLPEVEPYLWDRLVWHSSRAQLKSSTLVGLGLDLDRLALRIRRDGTRQADRDLREVAAVAGLGTEAPPEQMRRVLRHGGLFEELAQGDLRSSLACWLQSVGVADIVDIAAKFVGGRLPMPSSALERTLRGHSGAVWGVAFAPGGQRLATAGEDRTVRLWDAGSGEQFIELSGHTGAVLGVAFAPNRQRLATAGDDRTARLWDTETGEPIIKLSGHTGAVLGVAFAPNGQRLATAGDDRTARLWDTETGEQLVELSGHLGAVWGVAFAPNGQRLATAGYDRTARLWDTETGEQLVELSGHLGAVLGVAFAPDGQRIATASFDGTARLWDTETGEQLVELSGHIGGVWRVAFAPDGQRIATASNDGTARLWDTETGEQLVELLGHTGGVWEVAFAPDGQRIATASNDGTARLWDIGSAEPLIELSGHTGAVWGVAFAPDGQRIVTASFDGTARLWDTETGEPLVKLSGHTGVVRGVAFAPDGQRIVTASDDGTARLWDTETGEPLIELSGHTGGVNGVAFAPDGQRIATASDDRTARLWDTETGEQLVELSGHTGEVWAVAFAPDGQRLATVSDDRTARLWDTETGEQLVELSGHTGPVRAVAFAPDGQRLATAGDDGTARLWDTETGEQLVELSGHTGEVWGVAFAPDGQRLATVSDDGTARLWDTGSAEQLLNLALAATFAIAWHGNRILVAAGRSWAVIEVATARDLALSRRTPGRAGP